LWEKGSSGGIKLGGRYLNSEQDFEFGSRVGCWRIFRLMKEFGWNMTLWAIAKAMERNPDFANACVREGHEIGAHGLRWLEFWDYSVEEDKKYIRQTWEALHKATGEMKGRILLGPRDSKHARHGTYRPKRDGSKASIRRHHTPRILFYDHVHTRF
jgi:peptidoglycan/xylan/chitin deacetylase (PgdA/CDA1 family)